MCTCLVVQYEYDTEHIQIVSYPDPDSQQLRVDYITAMWIILFTVIIIYVMLVWGQD